MFSWTKSTMLIKGNSKRWNSTQKQAEPTSLNEKSVQPAADIGKAAGDASSDTTAAPPPPVQSMPLFEGRWWYWTKRIGAVSVVGLIGTVVGLAYYDNSGWYHGSRSTCCYAVYLIHICDRRICCNFERWPSIII